MMDVWVHNLTTPLQAPLRAQPCTSFACQLRGLMFRKALPPHWGLLLVQPREGRLETAIHMLFMRLDLGVIWVNGQGVVVDARPAYRWRSILIPRQPARFVLETSLAYLEDFRLGDHLHLENLAV